jgi:hypothetical protein
MDQFARAEITIDGKNQPLVKETKTLLEFRNSKLNTDFQWPVLVFAVFFLVVSGITVRSYLQNKKVDWLDYSLFALSGFAGLIIGWFTLFSEHPAMSPNYNLLWAFPLNLIFAGLWTIKKWRAVTRYYFWIAGGVLLLSLVTGQPFNPAVYFLILSLLVRVGVNLIPGRK